MFGREVSLNFYPNCVSNVLKRNTVHVDKIYIAEMLTRFYTTVVFNIFLDDNFFHEFFTKKKNINIQANNDQ